MSQTLNPMGNSPFSGTPTVQPAPGIIVTARKSQSKKLSPQSQQSRSPCDVAATEKGKVVTGQLSATAILALGLTGSVGYFQNQQTGTSGYFITVGGGAGADAGVALTGSNYNNAGSLVGFNNNLNVSLSIPFGVSWSQHNDLNGNRVGNSFGLSYGPKAGISGTTTSTSLFWCKLGGN